uniref:Uncharacterized protein n=1 Tax=viral metagenome TaxID=1070528 RepID=A0A6C0J241_9ZZZZ
MSKRKSNIKSIDLNPEDIPVNCNQIVITQNKTKIVIKTDSDITSSVSNKQDLIMRKVKRFFDKQENFEKLKPMLIQECNISLRVLDWSTTNWSKKNTIILETYRNGYKEIINMFLDYKANLKAFSKKSFDPFCRRERIMLRFECDPEKKTYITTTAQLNFMKWAIESGVLDYCKANIKLIEEDMVKSLKVRTPNTESIARRVTVNVGEVQIGL